MILAVGPTVIVDLHTGKPYGWRTDSQCEATAT